METMSHSRGILEYYDLTPTSFDWMRGKSEWEPWALVEEKIGWLPRNAKYPTYRPLDMQAMTGIYDEVVDKEAFENPPLSLAKLFNPTYFSRMFAKKTGRNFPSFRKKITLSIRSGQKRVFLSQEK